MYFESLGAHRASSVAFERPEVTGLPSVPPYVTGMGSTDGAPQPEGAKLACMKRLAV